MKRATTLSSRTAVALAAIFAVALPAEAQTKVNPGFNVFSADQDVEIGKQSAVEAERQLPLLRDSSVEGYARDLLERLAPNAPGPKFPYSVKVVNASDINAFALPGGPLYLNRGLLQAARTEGELAGVMAHEIAHIALRHGTHNASKAYLTQAGLGILGGIIGRGKSRSTQSIINLVGGFGLNALFLKYSRDAETQADIVGAQILARSGYDPMEMATFFEVLEKQRGGGGGGAAQFFSSHPAPANRRTRIQQEARLIGAPTGSARGTGQFASIQSELRGMGAAPSMEQIARGQGGSTGRTGPVSVSVEAPSSRFEVFRHGRDYFQIEHPENWEAFQAQDGFGVTFVPRGGVVELDNGRDAIVYGVIVNHYDPFDGGSAGRGVTLDTATDDLLKQIQSTNTHLRSRGRTRREVVAGQNARSVVLSGNSPVTGQEERVTVFTREMPDGHVIYALFVAPGRDYDALSRTFTRMIQSLDVNDRAVHGQAR